MKCSVAQNDTYWLCAVYYTFFEFRARARRSMYCRSSRSDSRCRLGGDVGLGLASLARALNLVICRQESKSERMLCFPGIWTMVMEKEYFPHRKNI